MVDNSIFIYILIIIVVTEDCFVCTYEVLGEVILVYR